MKIGYVLRSLEDSGVTVYCLRLADAMRRRGHDVFLVSDGGLYEREVERLRLRRIPLALCRNPLASWLAARRLTDIVRRERPDILHANWRRAQLACHLAQRKLGTPFVTTLHLVGIPDNRLYRRFTYWGDRVIAPCTEAVDYLRQRFGVPQQRIRLVFHGVDPDQWPVATPQRKADARRQLHLPDKAVVLVCVARLEKIKGHDVLLSALAKARAVHADLTLLLVGAGQEESSLRCLAAKLQLGDSVRFLGYTDPHEPLAAADAFVLASRHESFGFAPVEAMLTGLPVIRTATEGARDQVRPGETGEIAPVDDVAALANVLAGVAARGHQWRRCGQAACEDATARFTVSIMAQKIEALYREVVAEAGSHALSRGGP